jgi:signal transduction histidine kinase
MVHLFGRTIRSHVLAIVLLGTFVPLALVGAWLTRGGVRSGEDLLEQQLTVSLESVMRDMTRRWELRRGDLLMIADGPVARLAASGTLGQADSAFLAQAANAVDRSIVSFEYLDRGGKERWSFSRAPSASDSILGDGRVNAVPLVDVEFPVRGAGGAVLGRMRARMRLNGILWADSAKLAVPGSVLAAREMPTGRVLVPLSSAAGFPDAGVQRVDGTSSLVVTRRFAEPPIELAVVAGTAPYVAPFQKAATVGLLALVMAAAFSLLVTVFMATRLARSVDQLASAADSVSRGELSTEVRASGPLELERLARAFNVMTDSLRRVLAELAQRRALAAVGEFAASLSHEVRNTLTPIEVDLERAQERVAEDARTHGLVTRALSQVRKLEREVTGALVIARSGRVVAGDVNLDEVLRAAVEGTHAAFEAIRGRVELSEFQQALRVRGDADALRHLFVNLLLNASQAISAGGVTRVDARQDEDRVVISVVDDGAGISDENLARAGQPFFTTRADGTGLGLPIARQIATAHGGAIEISRANGRGTVVRVSLPQVPTYRSEQSIERFVPVAVNGQIPK